MGSDETRKLLEAWSFQSATIANLRERYDEAMILADNIEKVIGDAEASAALVEAQAVAALRRDTGSITLHGVRFRAVERGGTWRLIAEPMGKFGVISTTRGGAA